MKLLLCQLYFDFDDHMSSLRIKRNTPIDRLFSLSSFSIETHFSHSGHIISLRTNLSLSLAVTAIVPFL